MTSDQQSQEFKFRSQAIDLKDVSNYYRGSQSLFKILSRSDQSQIADNAEVIYGGCCCRTRERKKRNYIYIQNPASSIFRRLLRFGNWSLSSRTVKCLKVPRINTWIAHSFFEIYLNTAVFRTLSCLQRKVLCRCTSYSDSIILLTHPPRL